MPFSKGNKRNATTATAAAALLLGLGMFSSTSEGFAPIAPPQHQQHPTTTLTSGTRPTSTSLYFVFEQKPGESDIEFIRRITSPGAVEEAAALKAAASSLKAHKFVNGTGAALDNDEDEDAPPVKKSGYQRIEEWDAKRNDKGSMTYEQKLQFDGQRFGNQVRQDSILRRHLGTW